MHLIVLKLNKTHIRRYKCDFRLPPRNRWDLCFSGKLYSI